MPNGRNANEQGTHQKSKKLPFLLFPLVQNRIEIQQRQKFHIGSMDAEYSQYIWYTPV